MNCLPKLAIRVGAPSRSGLLFFGRWLCLPLLLTLTERVPAATVNDPAWTNLQLANVVEQLLPLGRRKELPIAVKPFIEHVREAVPGAPISGVRSLRFDASGALVVVTDSGAVRRDANGTWSPATEPKKLEAGSPADATVSARGKSGSWYGSTTGLYHSRGPGAPAVKQEHYGVDGPLAPRITALALDSKETLWVGTPLGLSTRTAEGKWTALHGQDGLPVEDITALAVDREDNLWIGTSRGAILYQPLAQDRKWFYRAGRRYLSDDYVLAVACAPDGVPYFATRAGVSRIALQKTTLLERAQTIEKRVNQRHRRLGLVAECELNAAENPTSHVISDNDNDGLWTAYHVAAMSLCYGATKDPAAKASASESMHALYTLQNASGTPGLVARSVLPPEEGKKRGRQWRPTPDGKLYWKSDTSSDEIDGHYLAFYTYWEHVAKADPAARDRCIQQVRNLTDHLVDHNYQLIDWTGKRTSWGFWNPENLNDNPHHYIKNGLNSLQILSFLKVADYITGDAKYAAHYRKLIVEHHYLNNVLLEKKVFPDENNHSDDQLGFVAWYPILQLEQDPKLRAALHAGVRRHYLTVEREKPSFYIFAYATIDPNHADHAAGIENLREIPTDRRGWAMHNSQRADVTFDPVRDRFEQRQLLHVLPADERAFEKWNGNPYIPDGGGDGRHEDDGAAYLLPYWMARYHHFISGE